MAFFNKGGSRDKVFSTATIVTRGTSTYGNFIGNDSIHIDGIIDGDVKVNNIVVVGRSGEVRGKIQAQQVLVSGIVHGNIMCDSLEILPSAILKTKIEANKVLVKGKVKGPITCGGLFMEKEGLVESNVQAKTVIAGGKFIGNVACDELKITSSGYIKGKLFAHKIINQGGHVEGFIGKYSDLLLDNPNLLRDAKILSTQGQAQLLDHSEYYVDIEKEKENQKNDQNKSIGFVDVEFEVSDESKLSKILNHNKLEYAD
jgi:cytoskeletal protein CcmA (bactofilin family)